MAKKRIKRVKPDRPFPTPSMLPGLRGSADWHIKKAQGNGGFTINHSGADAEMVVPLDDSHDSKYIRIHELLHAAHSPLEAPRDVWVDGVLVSAHAIAMAEEIRIDSIARTMGGKESLPGFVKQVQRDVVETLALPYAKTGNPRFAEEMLSMAMATWAQDKRHMAEKHGMVEMILSQREGLVDEQRDRLYELALTFQYIFSGIFHTVWDEEFSDLFQHQTFPDWDSLLRLGSYIQAAFDALNGMDPQQAKATTDEVDEDLQALARKANQMKAPLGKIRDALKEAESKIKAPPPSALDSDEELKWGEMNIVRPPRDLRLPKTKTIRSKYQATDIGASPRYIHRLLTDGQVFARKRREPGGSVLIDDSGSMSWENEEIEDIVEAAPAIDIAAYSAPGPVGQLMIIAEDGTWADVNKYRPAGSGNVVDFPALEWLATKAEPRIWVTDSQVIPVQGSTAEGAKQCMEFAKANNINIVRHAHEAAEIFKGKRAIYR
jgi:hypothetical protein